MKYLYIKTKNNQKLIEISENDLYKIVLIVDCIKNICNGHDLCLTKVEEDVYNYIIKLIREIGYARYRIKSKDILNVEQIKLIDVKSVDILL